MGAPSREGMVAYERLEGVEVGRLEGLEEERSG
jgi:hypothetical protein